MPVTPLPFTPDMNWESPLLETLEFETVIIPFASGNEQREALMVTPHRQLSYLVSALEPQEAGLIEALAYAGQALEYWVPYWRGARWLETARSAGATTLTMDTTLLGYEVGQGVMFLSGVVRVEVSVLTGVSGAGLVFGALTASWAAAGTSRARVVPVYRGLLSPSVDFDYVERSAKLVRVTFDILP